MHRRGCFDRARQRRAWPIAPIAAVAKALVLLLWPGSALADGLGGVPLGARTAAMGGAGVAAGRDSAMPLLNPAGLALVPRTTFQVSASLYHVQLVDRPRFNGEPQTESARYGRLTLDRPDVRSLQFSAFPSGLAYVLHDAEYLGPVVLGASLTVPRNIERQVVMDVQASGSGVRIADSSTSIVQERQYVGGLSAALPLDRLRLGASVLFAYSSSLVTLDDSALALHEDGTFQRVDFSERLRATSYDLGVVLGAQLSVRTDLDVGLAVRVPSVHLGSDGSRAAEYTVADGQQTPDGPLAGVAAVSQQSDLELTLGLPFRAVLGAEYRGAGWAVAADMELVWPRAGERESRILHTQGSAIAELPTAIPERDRERLRPVVNAAIGFEHRVGESSLLRVGAFTDLSAEDPDPAKLSSMMSVPIDRFGLSAGWGTQLGPVDTTIGVRIAGGTGRGFRIVPAERFGTATEVLSQHLERSDVRVLDGYVFLSAALDSTIEEALRSRKRDAPP